MNDTLVSITMFSLTYNLLKSLSSTGRNDKKGSTVSKTKWSKRPQDFLKKYRGRTEKYTLITQNAWIKVPHRKYNLFN